MMHEMDVRFVPTTLIATPATLNLACPVEELVTM